MKLLLSILSVCILSGSVYSQIAIGGGPSLLKAFGVRAPYYGGHIFFEKPTDDQTSYYGKLSVYAKQEGQNSVTYANAIDFTTNPQQIQVNSKPTFNYTTLEGGRRFYFGNGYDYGFSAYGGTHILAAFNSAKLSTDKFDNKKYQLATGNDTKGFIFNLAFGLSGGIKNDFAWGTLYLDVSVDYAILQVPSNQLAVDSYRDFGSPLLFTFGIGYKKNLYF